MKVKNDHCSKFSNLSNWKEEAWKKILLIIYWVHISLMGVMNSINWPRSPSKYWQHQLCGRGPGTSIGLHIPRQPYYHHRRHWGRCWGQVQEGTGCILHFKTQMAIKFHLTADKDKDLQFQCEVHPPIRIWDLEIDEEDHHPTSDFYQPQTPVHLGSVVAEKDFKWRAVAVHTARKDWSHHPEKKMAMDRPHF